MSNISLPEIISGTKGKFIEVAPSAINFHAERGFAIQILDGNSYLKHVAESNPVSLQQAIISVASIGLSLNPAEKQAYLITRNVKVSKNQWQTRVFLEPSYMGLCKLATDSGSILWVQANIVYSNDTFTDSGPGERPVHIYKAFAKVEERGEFVGVYCVAKTHDGDYLTTTMTAEEIESVRERSEAWKSFKAGKAKTGGPWQTDFGEQAKKTVVRRAFKMWPRTDLHRMAEAVNLSNENEGFEPILTSPEVRDYTADQKKYFDQLITESDAIGMHVFQRTTDLQVFTNLYHSFEKGTKGKYQRIIDDLLSKGRVECEQITMDLAAGISAGDDLAINEIRDDLSQEAMTYLVSTLPTELASAYQSM